MNANPIRVESCRQSRPSFVELDAHRATPVDLRCLWRELLTGSVRIIDHFYTEERCYLCLVPGKGTKRLRQCFSPRNIEILERVLLGDSQKAVAFDFDLSPSTVALAAARCLHALGLSCSASGVPMLIVMAVHSLRTETPALDARQSTVQHDGVSHAVVSAARPDNRLSQVLPGSECAVTRLRVQGCTYAEIADIRRTSRRTVANQLSTAFRRLQVSGRVGLLNHLIGSLPCPPSYLDRPAGRVWDIRDAS
jgi:DNA-binding NarL/FixJ family response regulator